MNTSYYAGLDIGGSTVKSALIDAQGAQVGDMVEVPSKVSDGFEATFGQMVEAMNQLAANAGIERAAVKAAGVAVPAPSSHGVVWGRANLAADWPGTDIQNGFSSFAGIDVCMTNDCNAAALSEYAARPDHEGELLYMAPGTGLGGGLVLKNGEIYEGANGLALEAGHISVPFQEDDGSLPDCSCGGKGCAEAWVSLVALRRRLSIELAKPEWASHSLNQSDDDIIRKAFRLRDLATDGDELALSIFAQQGRILGHAIADLVRVFDPGLVVIGGGLAETDFRETYLTWIQEGFANRILDIYRFSPLDPEQVTTRFEWALLGDAAGSLGLARMSLDQFGA